MKKEYWFLCAVRLRRGKQSAAGTAACRESAGSGRPVGEV